MSRFESRVLSLGSFARTWCVEGRTLLTGRFGGGQFAPSGPPAALAEGPTIPSRVWRRRTLFAGDADVELWGYLRIGVQVGAKTIIVTGHVGPI